MTDYLFIEPLDVLYLRGNRLFGEAGDHGEALMPPWPSLAAGAIRSRMLADGDVDLAAFADPDNKVTPAGSLGECLGTPAQPGSFRISRFTLGRNDNGKINPFLPQPADVVVRQDGADYLRPRQLHASLATGADLPLLPVLRQEKPKKPLTGHWLNRAGITAYLGGEPLVENHLAGPDTLWKDDPRLGIAMNPGSRTAEEGRIYTTETVALQKEVGFLAGVDGAAGCLPKGGLLRFGGDGRGAMVSHCRPDFPESPWPRIAVEKRFRVVLLSPGLFPDGWRLPGLQNENGTFIWRGDTFSARLVAAAVNRAEVVSGWDLALHVPKTAMRVAPTGSVYWLENLQGEMAGLQRLAQNGLWPLLEKPDLARRAEGFNNILIAAWPRN